MARKVSIAAMLVLLAIAALLLAGEYTVLRRSQEMCGICQRHINPKSGVIAEIGGRRQHVCCAHCAVTEGRQERKPVRLIEVTDYNSGRKLDPREAWYVDGSRVVACTHDMARMGEMKQVERIAYDRCSPGTFAFATRGEADAFATANGGVVHDLAALLATGGEVER